MRAKAFLFVLCSILLLGACGTPKTGGTIYNIMDYGAKGDGVTDDAAAIQAAIDQCSKSGGGTVLVPAGRTFMCSLSIWLHLWNCIWNLIPVCLPILMRLPIH